jgi:hypothetical protein
MDNEYNSFRTKILTEKFNPDGVGIEYGPLNRIVLEKTKWNVKYVDFASREFLVKHYSNNPNVNVDLIPEIDIVTDGKLIDKFLPHSSIDFVVASHVLEHVPDFIGWIKANLSILKVGGKIAIAYPDMKHCFDIKRRESVTSDLICAYLEERTKPNFSNICDFTWNAAKANPVDTWSGATTKENAEYIHDRMDLLDTLKRKVRYEGYTDCHCWTFTDTGILPVLNEIISLFFLPAKVVGFHNTCKNRLEFFFILEKI